MFVLADKFKVRISKRAVSITQLLPIFRAFLLNSESASHDFLEKNAILHQFKNSIQKDTRQWLGMKHLAWQKSDQLL